MVAYYQHVLQDSYFDDDFPIEVDDLVVGGSESQRGVLSDLIAHLEVVG